MIFLTWGNQKATMDIFNLQISFMYFQKQLKEVELFQIAYLCGLGMLLIFELECVPLEWRV